MSNKLGQEPAFPTEVGYVGNQMQESFQTGNEQAHYSGMSKRFYAACVAMQGLLASPTSYSFERLAENAFKCADELLKQENQ